MINNQNNKKVLPLGPMARMIGVSPKWLREQVSNGFIPGLPAGNTILFEPETVKKMLAKEATKGARP